MKVVEIGRDSQPGSAPYPLTLSILPFCNDAGQGQTLNFLPQHLSNGIYPSLNKSHMRLFHHFTTVTSGTLILGPQLWERKVMPTAFKHDYLMHALLFMAASHLRHLQPQENIHRRQELEHFSQVIPAFNTALSGPVTETNVYALCACSLLILQYSWACPDLTCPESNSDTVKFDFGSLLGLYSGMRRLGLSLLTVHDRYLHSVVFHRPIEAIRRYSENTNIPAELEEFFTHCCQCPKWSGSREDAFTTKMEAAHRLIPVLSALKLGVKDFKASGLMPDISRYLFVLPLLSSEEYAQLLRNNDEASLVILLYYFALVRRLLSGKFWWMRERSTHLCESLLITLGDKCERCVGWAREISSTQPLQ